MAYTKQTHQVMTVKPGSDDEEVDIIGIGLDNEIPLNIAQDSTSELTSDSDEEIYLKISSDSEEEESIDVVNENPSKHKSLLKESEENASELPSEIKVNNDERPSEKNSSELPSEIQVNNDERLLEKNSSELPSEIQVNNDERPSETNSSELPSEIQVNNDERTSEKNSSELPGEIQVNNNDCLSSDQVENDEITVGVNNNLEVVPKKTSKRKLNEKDKSRDRSHDAVTPKKTKNNVSRKSVQSTKKVTNQSDKSKTLKKQTTLLNFFIKLKDSSDGTRKSITYDAKNYDKATPPRRSRKSTKLTNGEISKTSIEKARNAIDVSKLPSLRIIIPKIDANGSITIKSNTSSIKTPQKSGIINTTGTPKLAKFKKKDSSKNDNSKKNVLSGSKTDNNTTKTPKLLKSKKQDSSKSIINKTNIRSETESDEDTAEISKLSNRMKKNSTNTVNNKKNVKSGTESDEDKRGTLKSPECKKKDGKRSIDKKKYVESGIESDEDTAEKPNKSKYKKKYNKKCFNNKNNNETQSESEYDENTSIIETILMSCPKCSQTQKVRGKAPEKCPECSEVRMLYKCRKCGNTFKSYFNMVFHVRKRCTGLVMFECDQCNYKHRYQCHVKYHIEDKHRPGGSQLYECPRCRGSYSNKYNMSKHEKTCGIAPHLLCKFCPYRIKYNPHLRNHIKKNHGDKFESIEELEAIIREIMEKGKKLRAKAYKALKNGTKEVVESKRTFQAVRVIHRHCPRCERRFDPTGNTYRKTCPECDTGFFYECDKCGLRNRVYNAMYMHVTTKCYARLSLSCEHCDFATTIKSSLASHMQYRHTTFEPEHLNRCERCDRGFRVLADLRGHEKYCQTDKHYECEICNFRTKHRSTYTQHMHRHLLREEDKGMANSLDDGSSDSDAKPKSKKAKKSRSSRKSRVRVVREREEVECESCGHTFKNALCLRSHQQYCGKSPKYACDHCGHRVRTKYELGRHIEMKHVEVFTDRSLKCRLCGVAMLNIYLFERHVAQCKTD